MVSHAALDSFSSACPQNTQVLTWEEAKLINWQPSLFPPGVEPQMH